MDIRDQYGNRTGSVDKDGTVRDQYGNRTGSVDKDGTFRDKYGERTGRVDEDGTIRDKYGNRTSSVDTIPLGGKKTSEDGHKRPRIHNTGGSSDGGGSWLITIFIFIVIYFFKALFYFLVGPVFELIKLKEIAARKEWWGTTIRSLLLASFFFGYSILIVGGFHPIALFICLVFGLLPIIAVSIRRMHDIGKSGWWILVPFYGFLLCGFFSLEEENEPQSTMNINPAERKRHGFTTFWLIFMLVSYAISLVVLFFTFEDLRWSTERLITTVGFSLFGICGIVFILRWWNGFWMVLGSFVLNPIFNILFHSASIFEELLGLISGIIGIGILFAVLQIRKNGMSTWKQLKWGKW